VSPNSITDQFPIVDVKPVRNLVGINRNELAQLQATDLLRLVIYTALETLADKNYRITSFSLGILARLA
jgi:hypothetical protein